jgi:hypothetical protein
MGTVTKTYTFAAGNKILSAEVNSDFDTLYNLVNGNIDNDNIKANAGIVDTKLAQISTASKVDTDALTTTSGAVGDILYHNGTKWTRLAAGTDKYILGANGAAAPAWLAPATAAEVKTGTDTEKPLVSTSVVGHEGIVKAWGSFVGSAATPAIVNGYNVDTAITDNGKGDYNITFTTDFGSADYAFAGSADEDNTDGSNENTNVMIDGTATTGIRIIVKQHDGAVRDSNYVSFMAIGDQ